MTIETPSDLPMTLTAQVRHFTWGNDARNGCRFLTAYRQLIKKAHEVC